MKPKSSKPPKKKTKLETKLSQKSSPSTERLKPRPYQEVKTRIEGNDLKVSLHSPDQFLLKFVQDAVFYAIGDYTEMANARTEGPFNRREEQEEEPKEPTRVLGLDTQELITAREESEEDGD